jgi:hypothetical protein
MNSRDGGPVRFDCKSDPVAQNSFENWRPKFKAEPHQVAANADERKIDARDGRRITLLAVIVVTRHVDALVR